VLKNNPEVVDLAAKNEAAFGTLDSWLLWNLTGGKLHATDYSNISATALWDPFVSLSFNPISNDI
jgi:glycerol kinase